MWNCLSVKCKNITQLNRSRKWMKSFAVMAVLLWGNTSFLQAQEATSSIVFISDTQQPIWIEKLIHNNSYHNEEATDTLLASIIRAHPLTLFMTGDMVGIGSKKKYWRLMDKYLSLAQKAGIPVHALLGNHDLMWNARKGMAIFQQRFPSDNAYYYTVVTDSIAVLMLNSNFSKMDKARITQQQSWYVKQIDSLDNANDIKYIIVCCHHSPFSNSAVVGSNKKVQEECVPAFAKSKKGKLFISGHAHLFEHFRMEGKDFIVNGGGGGLQQKRVIGKDSLPELNTDYHPMFHYLTVSRKGNFLQVISCRLQSDRLGIDKGYEFQIKD